MCVGNRTGLKTKERSMWSHEVTKKISLFFQLSSEFPCFCCLFLLLCLYLLLFSQLPQEVVTSHDVLVLLQEVKDLPESATEAYFVCFGFLGFFVFS